MQNFKMPSKKELASRLETSYKKAMMDKDFNNLVKNLKLKKDLVLKNVSKLEETVLELDNCKTCKGFHECKNKVKGHVYYPSPNNDKLDFDYITCKFEKKRLKALEEKETNSKQVEFARMKDIDITDKKRVEFIKLIKTFYDDFDPGKNMKGMYVHGSFGSGKTYLLSSLFNELKIKKNVESIIVYFPELLRNLREDFDLLERKIRELKYIDLLLIDDIGAENVSAWSRDEVLGTILQHRMNENLPTFFTSNLNIKELENHLSLTKNNEDKVKARRIIERIKQLTTEIELISANRRN